MIQYFFKVWLLLSLFQSIYYISRFLSLLVSWFSSPFFLFPVPRHSAALAPPVASRAAALLGGFHRMNSWDQVLEAMIAGREKGIDNVKRSSRTGTTNATKTTTTNIPHYITEVVTKETGSGTVCLRYPEITPLREGGREGEKREVTPPPTSI